LLCAFRKLANAGLPAVVAANVMACIVDGSFDTGC
jgi:hypothetical protein